MKKWSVGVMVCLSILLTQNNAAWAVTTKTGASGLFTVMTADSLKKGQVELGLYTDNYKRRYEFFPYLADVDITVLPETLVERYDFALAISFGLTNWLEFHGNFVHTLQYVYPKDVASIWPQDPPLKSSYRDSEITDAILGFKFSAYQNDAMQMGLDGDLSIKFPFGDEDWGMGTGEVDFRGRLIFSKRFGNFGMHLNGEYGVAGEASDLPVNTDVYMGGLGLEYNLNRFVQLMMETTYANPVMKGQKEEDFDVLLGTRFHIKPKTKGLEFTKYFWTFGAALRYEPLEESDDNPYGFIFHISLSPQLSSDDYKSMGDADDVVIPEMGDQESETTTEESTEPSEETTETEESEETTENLE